MGFPFHLFYTPALPYLVAILNLITDTSVTSGYRLLSGIFYAAIPATLFLFVYYLTRRRFTALVAALIYWSPQRPSRERTCTLTRYASRTQS